MLPSPRRDGKPLTTYGRRRARVAALGWSGRRRGATVDHSTSSATSSLGGGGTQGLQINGFSVFFIPLPHELCIMQPTCIAQSPRTIWTSPPFRGLANIARVAFSGRRGSASFPVLILLVTNYGATSGRSPLIPDDFHILLSGGLLNIGFLR